MKDKTKEDKQILIIQIFSEILIKLKGKKRICKDFQKKLNKRKMKMKI